MNKPFNYIKEEFKRDPEVYMIGIGSIFLGYAFGLAVVLADPSLYKDKPQIEIKQETSNLEKILLNP